MFICPLCGSGTGKHRTGALRITSTNRVLCFACGGFSDGCHKTTDTLGALEIILRTDENGAFDYCRGKLEGLPPSQDPRAQPVTRIQRPARDNTTFYEEAHKALFSFPGGFEYLQGRGITKDSMIRFNLGFCPSWKHSRAGEGVRPSPRIIIPRTKETYLARRIDTPRNDYERPYIKQVEGTQSDIFNGPDLEKPVCFITEGELDAISLFQVGAPAAVAMGTVENAGTLGTMARPGSVYILLLDNDPAGIMAQRSLSRTLKQRRIRALCPDPGKVYTGFKDPNEMLVKDQDFLKDAVNQLTRYGGKFL